MFGYKDRFPYGRWLKYVDGIPIMNQVFTQRFYRMGGTIWRVLLVHICPQMSSLVQLVQNHFASTFVTI
jgi:hypothetical protein